MTVRIVLADDHQLMRQGLRSLIDKQDGMEVLAETDNGRGAVELAARLQPSLVIMDISMPDLNGVEATRQIVQNGGNTRVIALSMHGDRQLVIHMLEAGASGYLLKDCALTELVNAVRTVASGRKYLSPSVTGVVVDDYLRRTSGSKSTRPPAQLTPKEREVLQLVAEGKTTKETAQKLGVSGKTVETHRRHIMEKLALFSVAELTKYAIREGLTSVDK